MSDPVFNFDHDVLKRTATTKTIKKQNKQITWTRNELHAIKAFFNFLKTVALRLLLLG